jgi:hypothetical protein
MLLVGVRSGLLDPGTQGYVVGRCPVRFIGSSDSGYFVGKDLGIGQEEQTSAERGMKNWNTVMENKKKRANTKRFEGEGR